MPDFTWTQKAIELFTDLMQCPWWVVKAEELDMPEKHRNTRLRERLKMLEQEVGSAPSSLETQIEQLTQINRGLMASWDRELVARSERELEIDRLLQDRSVESEKVHILETSVEQLTRELDEARALADSNGSTAYKMMQENDRLRAELEERANPCLAHVDECDRLRAALERLADHEDPLWEHPPDVARTFAREALGVDLTATRPQDSTDRGLRGGKLIAKLAESLRSWAQNEEMIDQHYTAHGRDCNKAADALDERDRLRGEK